MQLIIAEKPSVARSIAGVIGADQKRDGYMEGNGYLVSWCIGHLVSLADAAAYCFVCWYGNEILKGHDHCLFPVNCFDTGKYRRLDNGK